MELTDETAGPTRAVTRAAIVTVAAGLLDTGGSAAVTTRAVAGAAGVQAPTIYRLFNDKEGLLEAVAEHVLAAYVEAKVVGEGTGDPVADLDDGWDTHIGFGLANPALFALMSDPERGTRLLTKAGVKDILGDRVHRVALAGRLRIAEKRAVEVIRAAGTGVVLTLLKMSPAERDLSLVESVYGAVKREIIVDVPMLPQKDATTAAIALRANLSNVTGLSTAERGLMIEWLDRIASS